jgi:hypothetical protein
VPGAFTTISAGRFTARREDVRGQDILLVLDVAGRPLLSVGSPSIETAHITRPTSGGVSLAAAGGSWLVPPPEPDPNVVAVLDPDGVEVATIRIAGVRTRRIVLPSRTLTFTVARLRPLYRVAGLYSADRAKPQAPMPGVAAAVFGGEVTGALASAPDAPLIFGLAALITWRLISATAADEARRIA